jgi:hypothetical protein
MKVKIIIIISEKQFKENIPLFKAKAKEYGFDEPYYVIETEYYDDIFDYFEVNRNKLDVCYSTQTVTTDIQNLEVPKVILKKLIINKLKGD